MQSDHKAYRLLVVEDNPMDVLMLRRALAKSNVSYEMVIMEDGEEAIEYLERCSEGTKPDLVVIDLNLPGQDGLDVLRKYRFRPLLVNTPIMVLTSSGAPGDRNRAEVLGVDAYIRKPNQVDAFIAIGETIRRLLESSTGLQTQA